MYGVVFFPIVVGSVSIIAGIWFFISESSSIGKIFAQIAVDGMHILMFVPGVLLAGILMYPVIKIIERIFPD